MKIFGKNCVKEFLGDRIVFRNLTPIDPALPNLENIRRQIGLFNGPVPRKHETDYARVIFQLLKLARAQEAPKADIKRIVYLGDTRMSDGTAFSNICQVGGLPGIIFIGSERIDQPPSTQVIDQGKETIVLANRWSALDEFEEMFQKRGFEIDEHMAVILDLDKTAIGARGRNDKVIDRARVNAAFQIANDLLGNRFDREKFRTIYDRLNKPEFHPFTADNQDFLVYICLVLESGLLDVEIVVEDVCRGRMRSFEAFVDSINLREDELPNGLRAAHKDFFHFLAQGDPTPFKTFRRYEYQNTIDQMGCLLNETPVDQMIKEEIVITQEVRAKALDWQKAGALLFGLSDKPDEASIPEKTLADRGYPMIHQAETHIVGA